GAFLIFTGIKMATASSEPEVNPKANPVVKWISRFMPVTNELVGGKFFVKREGMIFATPLFIVLIMVETTDLVFAMDSIPAILAISRDTFIVYTSNVFALLGLRALYFALAGIMQLFHYLHYGLALILVFIGAKLVLSDIYHFDMRIALGIVGGILILSVVASLLFPKKDTEDLPVKPD